MQAIKLIPKTLQLRIDGSEQLIHVFQAWICLHADVLVHVYLDTRGTERQQAAFAAAEISQYFFSMKGTAYLGDLRTDFLSLLAHQACPHSIQNSYNPKIAGDICMMYDIDAIIYVDDNRSAGIFLLEGALSLEIDLVSQDPKWMCLHGVACDFPDLVGEAFIIEEGDVGELVLLKEVAKGRVAWGDCRGEDWDGVHVFGKQVLQLGAGH